MATNDFLYFLNEKLNIDDIFGSYIIGILEGDETPEEKTEALEGILSEITDKNLADLTSTIIAKWHECHPQNNDSDAKCSAARSIDVNEQLAKLLEAQKLQITTKERQYTEEERRIREQILAQYSQTEVSEDDDDDTEGEHEKTNATSSSSNAIGGIERNTNVQDVLQLQKERREQARVDSAAKKQKDKEDREKQKQLREEKKEKRKTVKGERRR